MAACVRMQQQLQQVPFSRHTSKLNLRFIPLFPVQVNGSMNDLVTARIAQALVKERQLLQQHCDSSDVHALPQLQRLLVGMVEQHRDASAGHVDTVIKLCR